MQSSQGKRSILDYILHHCRTSPTTEAIVSAGKTMTYECLSREISKVSNYIQNSDRHLQEGVAWVAGDIRARHVYVKGENANAVLQRWANKLGDNFTVLSRQQAIAACLFGDSVSAAYEQRLGDLIVYPSGLGGIVKSKTEKHPTSWKAHHGSLTEADQLVPLLNCFNE